MITEIIKKSRFLIRIAPPYPTLNKCYVSFRAFHNIKTSIYNDLYHFLSMVEPFLTVLFAFFFLTPVKKFLSLTMLIQFETAPERA